MQLPFSLVSTSQVKEDLPIVDGSLFFWPHFLDEHEADECLRVLVAETPWRQDTLRFGGKAVPIPRLQAWYGEKDSLYGYSGLALTPLPWTPRLLQLKTRIEDAAEVTFNSVLINYYRDGQDSVSWHSDDETELGDNPVIASLSLGVTRRFELKHRHKKVQKVTCDLCHGSLLIMGPGVQAHWQHQIPKQPEIVDGRINLTFRAIKPSHQD